MELEGFNRPLAQIRHCYLEKRLKLDHRFVPLGRVGTRARTAISFSVPRNESATPNRNLKKSFFRKNDMKP